MYSSDQTYLLINNSGVLAESATLTTSNQLQPNYQVGKRGIASITPNGPIKNVFSFSYFPRLNHDFPFLHVSGLRDLTNDFYSNVVNIEFCGITGFNCLLQNYSLHVEPNTLVRAQASYISYNELSGTLLPKNPSYGPTGNQLAWGPSVFITTKTGYYYTPVFSFDYNFSADFQPIYTFGNSNPIQVNYMGGDESMTFVRDNLIKIYFSGKDAYNNTDNSYIVNSGTEDPFINVTLICSTGNETDYPSFVFNISGAKITNSEMSARVDDYLKSTTTIVNYY